MQRETLIDILEVIAPHDIPKTVLTLRFNAALTIDSILRKEEEYLLVRGREAGTNDEYRLFFVPYEEILFLKIDRVMKHEEVKQMYEGGLKVTPDDEPTTNATEDKKIDDTPAPAMDPASIAKQNLLARIRAARTTNIPSKT